MDFYKPNKISVNKVIKFIQKNIKKTKFLILKIKIDFLFYDL